MFSQDFFLAIILQDSSPGEGQHRAGHDVGWGWQGEQRKRMPGLDDGDEVVWLCWQRRGICHRCLLYAYVRDMFACTCVW
jgi:hypothetical protein